MTVIWHSTMLAEQEKSVPDVWHTVIEKTEIVDEGEYKLIVSGDITITNKNGKGMVRLMIDSTEKRTHTFTVDEGGDWLSFSWLCYFNVPTTASHTIKVQGIFIGVGSIKSKELNILLEKY